MSISERVERRPMTQEERADWTRRIRQKTCGEAAAGVSGARHVGGIAARPRGDRDRLHVESGGGWPAALMTARRWPGTDLPGFYPGTMTLAF